ncbi:MAG TPA: flippase [Terriglobia bacterium]|nr:flippase [Terriglobia bacterium]
MSGEGATRGRLLARNTILNLIGFAAPLPVGLLCIPFIIRGLGVDRFGVLTLIWTVVGYMSLFDLGLGRALTQFVADRLGSGRTEGMSSPVWTSLLLLFGLGVVAGALLVAISPWLVRIVLRIPPALEVETLRASYLLAISLPFVLSMSGLRGVLEALQRFGLVNAIRVPTGVFSFVGPLLALVFSRSLVAVVAVLVAGRLFFWLIHLVFCFRVMPELRRNIAVESSQVGPLFRFGSWVMVSNIISPLMVYADRFMIASLVSMAAVAYYATPLDVVTKLLIIPAAVAGVLFPAFATTFVQEPRRTALLAARGVKYVFLALFPIVLVVVVFARDGLSLWLGLDFARRGARVLQFLAVGTLINGLAQIPFALVQGCGRPDIAAKFHLCELPVYLVTAWWLIRSHGVEGAAIAWVARVTVDALLLFIAARRLLPGRSFVRREVAWVAGPAMVMLALGFLQLGLADRGVLAACALLAFVLAAWFLILAPDERTLVDHRLRAVFALIHDAGIQG